MSVFISFNFETGYDSAVVIERKLKEQGLDAWWFPDALNKHQIDSQIGTALDNCSRCILLWTNDPMSGWQTAEISTIRHQFRERVPGKVAEECFVIARAVDVVPPDGELPLFLGCEYIDFSIKNPEALEFSFLDATPPGLVPVTCGKGRRPRMVLPPDFKAGSGHHLIHGDFVDYDGPTQTRHCWMFLRDTYQQLYIQQPRPTITHKRRWGAPNLQIGGGITGIVLAAADDATHRRIVSEVLKQNFGAISDPAFIGSLDILEEVKFAST